MSAERRKQRSQLYDRSLRFWLAAEARRAELAGFVLADSSGLVLASSRDAPEVEEVAALAPLLSRPDDTGQSLAQQHQIPVSIQEMVVENSLLYLCALGDEERCEGGLESAAPGIRRILATN